MSTKSRIIELDITIYNSDMKRKIIDEYLQQDVSQSFIMQKYNIKGHSSILNWIRQFGLEAMYELKKAKAMKKSVDDKAILIAENQELKRRLSELESKLDSKAPDKQELEILERKLKQAQMTADFYQTMVDIAEKRFGIEIKKKHGAKQ